MTPEAAIYLIIWIVVILGGAWVLEYIASRMLAPDPLPRPARLVIWGIAFLLVLLVLLRHVGLLHAGQMAMLTV